MLIDQLLSSLAHDSGSRAIGVILSGTGSDGSRALADLQTGGALVIGQDPSSAKFDGMPVPAIDTGNVDLVLPPSEMWAAITSYRDGATKDDLQEDGIDWATMRILDLLRIEHEIDFKLYKPATVRRRIIRLRSYAA